MSIFNFLCSNIKIRKSALTAEESANKNKKIQSKECLQDEDFLIFLEKTQMSNDAINQETDASRANDIYFNCKKLIFSLIFF